MIYSSGTANYSNLYPKAFRKTRTIDYFLATKSGNVKTNLTIIIDKYFNYTVG